MFAPATPAQSERNGDDATMRHLVQYLMRTGTEQYNRGYYIQAEATFRMAQGYGEYLEPLERRKLGSLQEKTSLAAVERKRALEAKATGEGLVKQGQTEAARTRLEGVRDSEFLTEKERAEVATSLAGLARTDVARAGDEPVTSAPAAAGSKAADADALEQYRNRIAQKYYEGMKAYHSGDFATAEKGFTEVLESGLMPAAMAETIRGYLADIRKGGVKLGRERAVSPASEAAVTFPSARTSAVTGAPVTYAAEKTGAGNAQTEAERIEALYNQSWELYSGGELEAARRGFAEVAKSGLYSAPPGKRAEDYIKTIDRLLAARQEAPAQRPAQPKPVEVVRAKPIAAQAAPIQPVAVEPVQASANDSGAEPSSFIEVINRRRNIIRGHVEAVVGDAVNRAQERMAQGQFDDADEAVAGAQAVVDDQQLHLGDEMYKRYAGQLTQVRDRIGRAREARAKQLAQEKRMGSAEAARDYRKRAETERQQKIDELLERAEAYQKQQRYEAALGQVNSLLTIDPLHDEALTLKQTLEDVVFLRKQLDVRKEFRRERAELMVDTEKSQIPYSREITYPKNWRDIVEKRKPEEPIGLDPENMRVYEQLSETVDLSGLSAEMPFSEAIGVVKNSVEPPLNIVVLWRDLLDNADIQPSDPIDMDPLTNVELGTALKNLLNAVAGGFAELDYVVDRGIITVATEEGLPERRMETRVYDVSDLVSEPANYRGMGGMMGMMGGMGGGMMGGGMMGGSYGGGMMGGGMGGGMMGGGMGGMGMMGGMMGGGGYMGRFMAQSLRQLIQESIDPDSWFELSDLGEGTIMTYPTTQPKKLAVYQTAEVHEKIADLLDQLRKALGEQVSIEARYLVVSENFLEDIGLDLDFSYNIGGKWGLMTFSQGSSVVAAPSVGTGVAGNLGNITTENPGMGIIGGYGSVLDDLQVSFILRATQARSDSKSLAAPRLTVMSGESASFSLTDMVAYALPPTRTQGVFSGNDSDSTFSQSGQFQNVNFLNVGSMLSISPTISKDKKYVLLNIQTTQTDLLGFASLAVEDTGDDDDDDDDPNGAQAYTVDVPETETANVMTRVSVPDGGTLLLGGHKIAAQAEKEAGVPVLSKIPVLGALFTNRSKVRDERVLLILVKPTIILQDEKEQEAIAAMEESTDEYRLQY